ncbi:MAG: hypothetical protein WEB00_13130 [Dehalococcoidia bacterium]
MNLRVWTYTGSLMGIILLAGVAVFAASESVGGPPSPAVAPDGICLKTSADKALLQSLFQRAGADEQGLRSQPEAETSKEPSLAPDEAAAVLAFDARFPDVPPGWTSESTIDGYSPKSPLTGFCHLETLIQNPAVTTTRVFPAHPLKLDDGTTVTSPESVYVTTQGALVSVRRADDPGYGPGVGEPVLVNGLPGGIAIREGDQRVGIGWTDGEVAFDVDCELLTVDECMAIAESVK